MNNNKKSVTSFIVLFSGKFAFFGSFASIIGLIIVMMSDKWAAIVALIVFTIMLSIFTSFLVILLYKILDIKNTDHENRSTFIKYETLDGNTIIYETYKLIQVKKPY